jgi:hypothetical protein
MIIIAKGVDEALAVLSRLFDETCFELGHAGIEIRHRLRISSTCCATADRSAPSEFSFLTATHQHADSMLQRLA